MYFDWEINQWKIESHIPPFPYLLMDNTGSNVSPIGRNSWKIVSTLENICGHVANTTIDLTLSSCYPDKFTCDNGDCIPLRLVVSHHFISAPM